MSMHARYAIAALRRAWPIRSDAREQQDRDNPFQRGRTAVDIRPTVTGEAEAVVAENEKWPR